MKKINKIIKMGYLLYMMGVISPEEFQLMERNGQKKNKDCSS